MGIGFCCAYNLIATLLPLRYIHPTLTVYFMCRETIMIEMSNVFSRTEAESSGEILSHSVYNLAIGLTLAWGFLVN